MSEVSLRKTPLKPVKSNRSQCCRICRIDIKAHGRSCVNIFGPKSRNEHILKRLAVVVGVEEIVSDEGLSENLCQKCYREFLKFERHLEQEKQLSCFRAGYKRSVQFQLEECSKGERQKRCAKDSPLVSQERKKVRSSNGIVKPTTRRVLLPRPAEVYSIDRNENVSPLPVSDDLFGNNSSSPATEVRRLTIFLKTFKRPYASLELLRWQDISVVLYVTGL